MLVDLQSNKLYQHALKLFPILLNAVYLKIHKRMIYLTYHNLLRMERQTFSVSLILITVLFCTLMFEFLLFSRKENDKWRQVVIQSVLKSPFILYRQVNSSECELLEYSYWSGHRHIVTLSATTKILSMCTLFQDVSWFNSLKLMVLL